MPSHPVGRPRLLSLPEAPEGSGLARRRAPQSAPQHSLAPPAGPAWTVCASPPAGALVKLATKKVGGPKGELLSVSPRSLPAPGSFQAGLLGGTSEEEARARFGLLQVFNVAVQKMFKYVFTGYTDRPHTLGAELAALRELLFAEVKLQFWAQMLDASAPIQPPKWIKEHPPPVITVNRHRAAKERPDRRAKMKNSIMGQLVQQLLHVDRALLVRRDRAFKVKFAGEAADDYGGPYREVFTMLCSELENEQVLPLLLQTPNGQHAAGSNRDKMIIQPASTSAELLQWYEMLGALMAMSLLQKETVVSLSLCSAAGGQRAAYPVWTAPPHRPARGGSKGSWRSCAPQRAA